MDTIFCKTDSIFKVVSVARNEPHRYGKDGELLINYEETEEHQRRASYLSGEKAAGHTHHASSEYSAEGGVRKNDSTDSS